MVSAVIKQIYTFLFVDILAAVATIISWKAKGWVRAGRRAQHPHGPRQSAAAMERVHSD
jgi:hypothetical protein